MRQPWNLSAGVCSLSTTMNVHILQRAKLSSVRELSLLWTLQWAVWKNILQAHRKAPGLYKYAAYLITCEFWKKAEKRKWLGASVPKCTVIRESGQIHTKEVLPQPCGHVWGCSLRSCFIEFRYIASILYCVVCSCMQFSHRQSHCGQLLGKLFAHVWLQHVRKGMIP